MNRIIKTIRNLIFICILLAVFLVSSGLRLTPMQAHMASEKSIHYGPSEVIKIFDHGDYQHMLSTYDKWVSCNTVERELLLFWRAGSQPIGFENDKTQTLDYSWHMSRTVSLFYGIANDTSITKIELFTSDGKTLVQDGLYDNLFYFSWEFEEQPPEIDKIIAYNSKGEILYENTSPY